jgi:hypothetical protein
VLSQKTKLDNTPHTMSLFIYYNKHDKTKEPHGKFEAIDLEDAILVASHIKDMNLQDFLKVFKVEQVFKNSTKKIIKILII